MADFNAAQAIHEAHERLEQTEKGERLVPVMTAIIAVFAALATLFSNHSSVGGLQARTQAGLLTTKAADQWNYYEAKRIKIEVNQAFIQAGAVKDARLVSAMQSRIAKEDSQAKSVMQKAQAEEANADAQLEKAERSIHAYENFEVSATLFEVCIVIVSITALMRSAKALLWVAGAATLVGLGFFITGMTMH